MDPFAGYQSIPTTQHPYMYGLNNPTRYTDPSGELVLAAATGIWLTIELAALGAGIATLVDYLAQIWGKGCVKDFWDLFDVDLVSMARTFATSFVTGMIAGIYLPFFPDALVKLLKIPGVGKYLTKLVVHFAVGSMAGIIGDMAGRLLEGVITGKQPDDTWNPNSYMGNLVWGGGFTAAGYVISEILEVMAVNKILERFFPKETFERGNQAFRDFMRNKWGQQVFEKGHNWGPLVDDGVLQTYDLVTFAYDYWAQHAQFKIFKHALKWAPRNGVYYEWVGGLIDIFMNDDAWSIILEGDE